MKLFALIILFINFYPTWTFLNRLHGKCIGIQSLSRVWLFETQRTAACQVSLSFAISWSWLKLMSLSWWCHPTISSSVVPFSSCPQSFPASGYFPVSQLFASGGQSIRVSASNISPSNEYPGLISFRMDWLDLLAVQGTLKSSPTP